MPNPFDRNDPKWWGDLYDRNNPYSAINNPQYERAYGGDKTDPLVQPPPAPPPPPAPAPQPANRSPQLRDAQAREQALTPQQKASRAADYLAADSEEAGVVNSGQPVRPGPPPTGFLGSSLETKGTGEVTFSDAPPSAAASHEVDGVVFSDAPPAPEPQVTFADAPPSAQATAGYNGPGAMFVNAAKAAWSYGKQAARLDEPLGMQNEAFPTPQPWGGSSEPDAGNSALSLLNWGLYDVSVVGDLIARAAMVPVAADAGWAAALAAQMVEPLPSAPDNLSSPYAQWAADQYNELLMRTKSGGMANDLTAMGEYAFLQGKGGGGIMPELGAAAVPRLSAAEAAAADARNASRDAGVVPLDGVSHEAPQMTPGEPQGPKQRISVRADATPAPDAPVAPQGLPEPRPAPTPIHPSDDPSPTPLAPPSDAPKPQPGPALDPASPVASPDQGVVPPPTPPPHEPPPAFAGNINLSRINTTDDVKGLIEAVSKTYPEAVPLTDVDLRQTAALAGLSGEKGLGILQKMVQTAELTPSMVYAARDMLRAQAESVWTLSKQAVLTGSPDHMVQALEQALRLITIQEGVSRITTSAGRTLRQFKLATGEGNALGLPKMVTSFFDPSKKAPAAKRTPEGVDPYLAMAQQLKGRSAEDIVHAMAKASSPEEIAAALPHMLKASGSDMVLEAWMNWGLLSSPSTHVANVLSNTLTTLLTVPESFIAAGISKVTGGDITFREAAARTAGMWEGMKEGFPAAFRAFMSESTNGPWATAETKLDTGKHQSIPSKQLYDGPYGGEFGGRQVRIPGRALLAGDEFFKAINYRMELNAQALRQALRESDAMAKNSPQPITDKARSDWVAQRAVELRANPDETLIGHSQQAAAYQTFTNRLGDFGNATLNAVNKAGVFGRLVVPFVRTPLNVMKYGFDHTPYPLIRDSLRDGWNKIVGREVKSSTWGALGKNEQAQTWAKMTMGSAIGGMSLYLASQGLLTGGGPRDPKERAVWFQENQPYSVKVGGDWYSYSRLEPLGMLFGIAADMHEIGNAMTEDEVGAVAKLVTGSIAKNITSKTWLAGLSDVIQVMNEPDRYGGKWLQRYAGTLVPAVVASVAREQDPMLRDARTILDAVKERIPGQRETLAVKNDVWGNPIDRDWLGPGFASPVYSSSPDNDKASQEILRLGHTFKGVYPGPLDRKFKGVDLNPAEYSLYTELSGKETKRAVDMTVHSQSYDRMPDYQKADYIRHAIMNGRQNGRGKTEAAMNKIGGFRENRIKAQARQRYGSSPYTPADSSTGSEQ